MCDDDDDDDDDVMTTLYALSTDHDTTASSLSMAVLLLQRHPHVWRKLVAEQVELSQHGPSISRSSLTKAMPFTEAVLREIWRYQPIVPGTGERLGASEDGDDLAPVVRKRYQTRFN